ncbi:MAG: hypothetical protein M2R45_00222 [Verrucomicrobia subdivision 3 bacterium]|nr:hypothetical protein [Limisphaerales bacterium]MCS1412320.1 hypothetical protein [Limisphaerales bacterium]
MSLAAPAGEPGLKSPVVPSLEKSSNLGRLMSTISIGEKSRLDCPLKTSFCNQGRMLLEDMILPP